MWQLQLIPLKIAVKSFITTFLQGTLLAHTFCYSLQNEVMCFVYCCGICVCVSVHSVRVYSAFAGPIAAANLPHPTESSWCCCCCENCCHFPLRAISGAKSFGLPPCHSICPSPHPAEKRLKTLPQIRLACNLFRNTTEIGFISRKIAFKL